MRSSANTVHLLIAVALVTNSGPLHAQGHHPQLAGHAFVSSTLMRDPFLDTRLSNVIALGSVFDYQVTAEIGGDTLVQAEGKMTWVMVDFDYLQNVTDWLALGAQVTGGARVGTNAASAISDGVSVITGFRLGGMARLVRTRSFALSANLDLARSNLTLLNISDFVQAAIDSAEAGGSLDSLSISSKTHSLQGRGGLRVAYVPTPLVGITGVAELALGEDLIGVEKTTVDFDLGALLDLNFRSTGGWPIGLTLGYLFSTFSDRSEVTRGNTQRAVIGVSYVGNEDFSIGVELVGQRLPLQGGETVNASILGVRSRYYF
jgi:hypothetical protein